MRVLVQPLQHLEVPVARDADPDGHEPRLAILHHEHALGARHHVIDVLAADIEVVPHPPARWEILEQEPGKVTFRLHGDRLKGEYHMFRFPKAGENEWLVFLGKDHRPDPDPIPELSPMLATPYTIAMPGIELQPSLAEGELQPATEDGDSWVGEFTFKEGLLWSDGEAITAEDFAFTWQTAVDLELQGPWQDYVDTDIVTAVEAVDDLTVRVTFNAQPGLAVWGPGTGVPLMPVMPEHFWGPVVEAAAETDDPRTTLLAESGAEAPSARN